jgi:hypothetical protein
MRWLFGAHLDTRRAASYTRLGVVSSSLLPDTWGSNRRLHDTRNTSAISSRTPLRCFGSTASAEAKSIDEKLGKINKKEAYVEAIAYFDPGSHRQVV